MSSKLNSVIILLMGSLALYVGISGWVVADFEARMERQVRAQKAGETTVVYEGVTFADVASAREVAEQDKITRYFRWVFMVPPGLPILLTSLAFGVLGGIANVVHKLAGSLPVPSKQLVFKPLFGGIIGLMVFGIASTAPKLIVETAEGVRPLSLMFLCLFAGTFSNHVFAWVEEKTKSVFPLGVPSAESTAAGQNSNPEAAR